MVESAGFQRESFPICRNHRDVQSFVAIPIKFVLSTSVSMSSGCNLL